MFNLPAEIILFDTEYTTWEGAQARKWSGPNEYKEIVQIGAIAVETETFTEKESLLLFIRPVKNPTLSQYFIDLTHITQDEVDQQGVTYADALVAFERWARGRQLFSWGRDIDVMEENAKLLGIDFPFDTSVGGDIRPLFTRRGIEVEQYMSSTIPRAFGEEPPPDGHNALNDARSIAQALRALAKKEAA
jgi:inhibitor of KinA sporulation pathway (predicted exonuclease)